MLGFNLNWVMAHLIGDYIFQNDWMAINKKKSNMVCLIHIITYMIPFAFTEITPLQFILIGAQHYIQDRTTFVSWFCRVTGKFKAEEGSKLPWGHFIVDNIFHAIWIMIVIYYFKQQ